MDYVYYKNFLLKDECDSILDVEYIRNGFLESKIGYGDNNPIFDSKIRNSKSVSLSPKDLPFLSKITDIILSANEYSKWNFSIDKIIDGQIIKYGIGDYFDWHNDDSIVNNHNNRKLTMIVSLNESKFYSGGNLFIQTSSRPENIKIEKIDILGDIGTALIFPSFYYHKVSKVLSGCRYSLVVWAGGSKWV